MSAADLVTRLLALGVKLWIDGDAVRFSAPRGALTAELKDELRARKEEIRTLLERSAVATPAPPITRVSRDGEIPASFAQQRLWFLDQLDPGSASYNAPFALRLTGALDAGALERALAEIVRRHEALRTTFASVDGRPVQVIHEATAASLPREDLSALPAEERERAMRARVAEESRRPFDLARGPLFRPLLIQLAGDEHVLVLVLHHIVSDGWSNGVLVRELGVLYEAFAAGRASPLPELPIQYVDYAAWQQRWLAGAPLERQLAYWKKQLDGAPRLLELPTDRPRPPVQAHAGAVRPFALGQAPSEALLELSRREGVTLFMTLLAAVDVLLARTTGQDDVVVGTPIANRTRAETEGLIGFFVNTLVMRTPIDRDLSFRDHLRRVRDVCLGAYAHQDMPFERLVQELDPDRDPGRSPLFQVLFSLQNAPGEGPRLPGLAVRRVGAAGTTAKFDLSIVVSEVERRVVGTIEHDTDLFDAATIDRMAAHVVVLLEGIAADPSRRLWELPLLPDDERQRLVVEWNDTAATFPRDAGLASLFEAQADATPDAIAVLYGDRSLSYRALDEQATRVGRLLRARGVGPDVLVGLCVHRSIEMVVGMLSILKAGGAYVPLDASYPKERLAFMADDARVRVVLTQADLAGDLPAGPALVCLDDGAPEIAAESAERFDGGGRGHHLAYVIYTSGSTGVPKGVCVPQRAVSRLVLGCNYVALGPSDRLAQASNASFDAATFEIWGALLNGARVVGIPKDVALSPRALAAKIEAQGITTLFLTTALFNGVIREVPSAFRGLRQVLFGGEACDPATVRAALRDGPERLLHVYGPTETTTYATWYLVKDVPEGATTVPIGRALSNTTLYVLDARREPVPIGVQGELYIGGEGVARGYLDRPELTAERFVNDPFSGNAGARLYKTGDLVRTLPDGNVVFVGRVDHQVKIRGFRVELGEIEAALLKHPAVREVLVMAREDVPGERRIVAYVAPADAPAALLRAFVGEHLPDYMVPSAFVLLEALPLNANGKVDRKALPPPEAAAHEDDAADAPRGPVEEALAAIFADVLKVPRVGARRSFFELGGHSLLATRVIARIRDTLGVEVPLRSLFEAPTPAELAERVEAALRDARGVEAPPLVRGAREEAPALSFAQERLWFLDQLEPGDPAYVIPLAIRLEGALEKHALERAFGELTRRHEVLRTTFASSGDRPIAVLHPEVSVELPVMTLADLPEGAREEALRAELSAEARRPFDLAAGPVMRARLVELAADDHVLFVTIHHIAVDGWSIGVLNREIVALYAAFREGLTPSLPELAIQYSDYARWQRRFLSGEALEHQLAYWRGQLEGAPRAIDLPTDRPRPAVQTSRGRLTSFKVPRETAAALEDLARREGATLFMTLLAAFGVLLQRTTGQDDIVVGSPIANRTRAEIEPLIGFFVNTLVLRVGVPDELTFRELLARVRETCLGAYAHQDMPFERLVQELAPDRDRSRSALFQVLFTLQNADVGAAELPGTRQRGVRLSHTTAKFDVTLALTSTPAGIAGALEYRSDLFDAETMERMAGHYQVLLESVARDASARLFELPLLTAAERHTLLVEYNDRSITFPVEATIHERVEAQVARAPDAPAVTCEGRTLSYRELDERSNRLAHHLRGLGVGAETLVGLCVRRSLDMMVGILGILKAGGAYLPLDPEVPRDRLAFMVEDAAVPIVLTHAEHVGVLPESAATIVQLDADAEAIAASPAHRPSRLARPDGLAYVIYTSGSTGKPKGALVTHANVVRLFDATAAWYRFGASDVWTMFHSYAFDFSVWEIWGALFYGGRVVLVPYWVSRSPEAFYALLRDERVTVLNQTPSAFRQLVGAEAAVPEAERTLALRTVIFGGEALDLNDLRPWWERHGDATPQLVNMYGITETTVHVTYRPVSIADLERPWSSVIGRPIPDLRAYILDRHRQPVPARVPGEMYVGGAGVARGYLNRPELTAERFLADPFGGPDDRLYKTGDLARFAANGDIEYLGRIDHQVKIRGFRIELGEIEAMLGLHPAVREVIVLLREDTPGDQRLVAYVVCPDGAPPAADFRASLKEKLPEYMVPSAFVALAAMPLTSNGKIDRKALPAPEARAASEGDATPPRGPIEEALAGIWADVLGVPRVGVHEGFFDLGGHSLLATQVMGRVARAFGVTVPLQALFEAPTVAGLAERVNEALAAGQGVDALPLVPVPRDEATELSFGQERLWFLSQLDPADPSYIVPLVIRLEGPLDEPALARALAEVVRRHEVLRTTFTTVDGRPVPVLHDVASVPLVTLDLRAQSLEDRGRGVREEVFAEARRPFDLATGPLLRMRLVSAADDDHVLLLTMHHIVSDAWSRAVLDREVLGLYWAFREGAPSPFAELPVQYADYAHWQRRYLSGGALDRQLAYWKQRLAGAPRALDLPTDRPRPAVQSHRGSQVSFVLPAELAEGLEALSRREGATLFMALLAAFDLLLSRYSGQDDIVVGTPIANRRHAETEGLIGFFLNTLVLRTELTGIASFRQLVHRVREACLGAYAHQDMPFERLVQELAPERDMSRSALFQVSFTVQDAEPPRGSVSGVHVRSGSVELTTAKFDLTLGMGRGPGGLGGALEYATDLFDHATVERMAAHLQILLAGLAAHPDAALDDLPLLAADERRRIVVAWNDTAVAYPKETLLHELFEAQAGRTPDRVAVVCGPRSITFRDLDTRANGVAHRLVELGIGPDRLVGVCMDRSIDLVAALLGVLKAGGAYVPLDPSYPKERLDYMIDDARASVLLTEDRLRGAISASGATILAIDADDARCRPASAPPARTATPESLAYVIYTSGSTGRPKGAMIPHRAIVNHMLWMRDTWPLGADDAVLQKTPMSFDASVWEFYAPLTEGARLVMAEPDGHRDPAYMARTIAEQRVTVLQLVPSMLELLLQEPGLDRCTSLRRLYCGGEALGRALVERFMARLGADVINLYGPTEAAIDSTSWVCRREGGTGGATEPIGTPIANMRAYVLGAGMRVAPIGVPGELYLGGAGVGRGYLGRPELTEERFVADPFGGAGDSLYRTGDLCRLLPSGAIEYLGRVDHQVKIRGFRIELGEIEAVLGQHVAVRESVVLARQDLPGEKRLVGYLVPADGPAPTVGDLRAFLKERLPDHMVPAAFVLLERLPLMANGKVDRSALPAPEEGDRPDLGGERVAPRSRVEEELARIWAGVLRIENVGVHDNFFAIGGDSILSIQIVARARQAGITLTPRHLFQHQTIAELAEVAGAVAAVVAEQGPVTGPVPLTPIQRAFLDQELVDAHHWNQAFLFELGDALEARALEDAVRALFEHHDALRLRLHRDAGVWQQRIAAPSGEAPLACVDLAAVPEGDLREAIEEAAGEAQASLSFTEGPIGRVVLFDLGPGRRQRLLFAIHHLAVDGVSWRILLEDLWTAYAQRRRGEPVALPPKTTSYQRWAERLVEHARSAAVADEEVFWLDDAGARAKALPVDHVRGDVTEASARHVSVSLGESQTEALLRDVPAAYRTQINDVLLAALAEAFSGWTGARVTLVDLEGHGREELFSDVDLTRTVGWFTAIFPVALAIDPVAGPGAALVAVKEQLRSVPNRGVGYGILRYLRGDDAVARTLAARRSAEVSFNYLGQFDQGATEGGSVRGARESSGPSQSPRARRRYLLEVNASISGGRLHARFTYSDDRHHRATIEDLAERYIASLRGLIEHCLAPGAGGATPSDFHNAILTQDMIDLVAAFDPSAGGDDDDAMAD